LTALLKQMCSADFNVYSISQADIKREAANNNVLESEFKSGLQDSKLSSSERAKATTKYMALLVEQTELNEAHDQLATLKLKLSGLTLSEQEHRLAEHSRSLIQDAGDRARLINELSLRLARSGATLDERKVALAKLTTDLRIQSRTKLVKLVQDFNLDLSMQEKLDSKNRKIALDIELQSHVVSCVKSALITNPGLDVNLLDSQVDFASMALTGVAFEAELALAEKSIRVATQHMDASQRDLVVAQQLATLREQAALIVQSSNGLRTKLRKAGATLSERNAQVKEQESALTQAMWRFAKNSWVALAGVASSKPLAEDAKVSAQIVEEVKQRLAAFQSSRDSAKSAAAAFPVQIVQAIRDVESQMLQQVESALLA